MTSPTPTFSTTTLSWFRPGLPLLVGSCALVTTAGVLGVSAVTTPIAGIPGGLWAIGLIHLAAAAARRLSAGELQQLSGSNHDARLALGRLASTGIHAMHSGAKALGVTGEPLEETARWWTQRLEHAHWPSAPLRIGVLRGCPAWEPLTTTSLPTGVGVDWLHIDASGTPDTDLRRHRLDALVMSHSEQGLRVITPEHPERQAAWYDWAAPRPLTYTNVFPVRLDASQLTLDAIDWSEESESTLAATLVVAAAALSRTPARLDLADRLQGRMPETAQACLEHLAAALRDASPALIPSDARRTATRLVSAWAAMSLDHATIASQAAFDTLDHEPELTLRAIAVRTALGDERGALELIARVRPMLHAHSAVDPDDHLPFVQGELEVGGSDPLVLGRLAAGITLVASLLPEDRLALFKDDFLDDASHADWLVGRDQDRALLLEVFRRVACGTKPLAAATTGTPIASTTPNPNPSPSPSPNANPSPRSSPRPDQSPVLAAIVPEGKRAHRTKKTKPRKRKAA